MRQCDVGVNVFRVAVCVRRVARETPLLHSWRRVAASQPTTVRSTRSEAWQYNVTRHEMPTKPKSPSDDGLPIRFFESAAQFESFLEENGQSSPGIHVKLAKKSSGITSIAPAEAVEMALCFGWIDGRANRLDDQYWLVRYTPRRGKSIWSQKNVGTVARLIEEGRMRESGLEVVEAAKNDGRWDRAYAGPATIQVPEDLVESLEEVPAAKAFFDGLNKSDRYSVLWRIETSSPRSRANRIDALVQMLAVGKVPGASTTAKVEPRGRRAVEKKAGKRTAKARVMKDK